MDIIVPGMSMRFEELVSCCQAALDWLLPTRSALDGLDKTCLQRAVGTAVAFLVADRHVEGIGRGGWGLSDREYMAFLHGEATAASSPPDSVMTTVVVTQALHAYAALLRQSESGTNNFLLAVWPEVRKELDGYLRTRWSARTGWGGTLAPDREADWSLRPSYRHTAWLLRLWLTLPEYRRHSVKTLECLIREYDAVEWDKEKVVTVVAAHSAFALALETKWLRDLSDSAQLESLTQACEGWLEHKYVPGIHGWTSSSGRETGRQLYTLLVLSETGRLAGNRSSALADLLNEALKATVSGKWRGSGNGGVPKDAGGQPDINASCLAASALLRRPGLLGQDQSTVLRQVLEYVVGTLSQPRADRTKGVYSWPLSYFVRDVCARLSQVGRE